MKVFTLVYCKLLVLMNQQQAAIFLMNNYLTTYTFGGEKLDGPSKLKSSLMWFWKVSRVFCSRLSSSLHLPSGNNCTPFYSLVSSFLVDSTKSHLLFLILSIYLIISHFILVWLLCISSPTFSLYSCMDLSIHDSYLFIWPDPPSDGDPRSLFSMYSSYT